MQKTTAVEKQEGNVFCLLLKRINQSFIMKVSVCCMLMIAISAQLLWAARTSAQGMEDKKITLELRDVTLKEALSKVEAASGFRLAYPTDVVLRYRNISLEKATRTVSATLDLLLQHTGLVYQQVSNRIILYKKSVTPAGNLVEQTPGVAASGQAASSNVSGRVTDAQGAPLLGVTVVIKGTSNGGITGENGRYELKNVQENAILVFSMIGFDKQEVSLNGQSVLDVVMRTTSTSKLNEVVVIGYGTTTQRSNTGAVSSITSKNIADQAAGDVLSALQGTVPGLFVSANNGLPGARFNVQLRGQNSIASGSDPLYVVDGVPYISEPLNQFNGANGAQSPLSNINPADIERIDVLKDADATAIYGSRGANGVILITTKKGHAGKTQVNLNVYTGIAKVTHMLDMLNTQQYLALRREAYQNDGVTPTAGNAPDLFLWDSTQTTNWQKLLMGHTAKTTEGQVSVSGGDAYTRFMLSGTYRHETTVQPGDQGYNRGAAHFTVDHSSQDGRFNVTASVNYTADKNNSIPTDIAQYYNLAPNYPVYDSTGKPYWFGNMQNPLAFLYRKYESRTNNLIGNATARYTVLPGLNLKANLGYTQTGMDQLQTYPQASLSTVNQTPSFSYFANTDIRSYIVEPQAEYTRHIGKGTLQLLAGASWQHSITEGQWLQADGYASDAMLENPKAASLTTLKNYNYAQYNYQAVFGRVNYNWMDKYFINGTFRRDGSSRFGPGKRFGNFGAVGAAWIFSEEHFISQPLPFLSYGKLRASYGTTGNDQIGDYSYLDSWMPTSFPYNGTSGLTPARLYNPVLSWEVTRKLELGLELGFLHDRILLTTAFYRNRSGSQLIDYTLSPQTGFRSIRANLPALVQNKGWEFSLNTVNVKTADFSWTSAFNLTVAKNKLLEFPGLESSSYAYSYDIGQSLSIVKGFHFTGVDAKTGLPQFQDTDGDSTITQDDGYVNIGDRAPKFFGGLQNTISYKNWQLGFLFQFVKQRGVGVNYGYISYPYGSIDNKDISALERWQHAGDVTNIPQASATSTSDAYKAYVNYYRLSDAMWQDASYIRLKNISLRYNLSKWAQRVKLQGCTIYLTAQNVFTITKYKGFDPETQFADPTRQNAVTPPLRSYNAGVQFTF